ncbi:hypothetical protein [uncultured Microscilla sp.]|uniref:hypothetical protein n=1 Tax=uncultured Microscilla sp. TaxID=432653 RepID=UPI00260B8959|nr:hypothetical protein [uncultured Microscilla sp.]
MVKLRNTQGQYVKQWMETVHLLDDKTFWHYAGMYGVIPQNFQYSRDNASQLLLNANFVNEGFAFKELQYFRRQAKNLHRFYNYTTQNIKK